GWNPANEPLPPLQGMGGATLTGLAMVEGIAQRLGGKVGSLRFPEAITLQEARQLFPTAATLTPENPSRGWIHVQAQSAATLGYLLRTAPAADGIFGYAGPTETLIALAPDARTLLGIRLRKSYDTEDYVERVTSDEGYLKSLTQWNAAQWPTLDFAAEKIEGVAGATMTSAAVAEGIRERFRQEATGKIQGAKSKLGTKDFALLAIVGGAILMSFSKWRGSRWVRMAWQAGLVLCLGLWLGQFVSLGLLVGWARHGLPYAQAAPLVVLAGMALLVPWAGRRQVYCHHVCAHGAAQEWLGRLPLPKKTLPPALHLTVYPNGLLQVRMPDWRPSGFCAVDIQPRNIRPPRPRRRAASGNRAFLNAQTKRHRPPNRTRCDKPTAGTPRNGLWDNLESQTAGKAREPRHPARPHRHRIGTHGSHTFPLATGLRHEPLQRQPLH
ncbi:MAG: 4Fe-4S binding protein, partial [Verrucomicrobia bacterium]|nr:4Fe-4S binding protein [Verrucomicrobiota bacterium]